MRDVKYIDDGLYEPTTERAFVSLKKLTLRGLPNLERTLEAEGVEMLPQLSYLRISCVPKLALPSLPSVEIINAGGMNYELLMLFSDYQFNEEVSSFPWGIACNMHNLKTLFIVHLEKLNVLPDDLSPLSALEELHISDCHKLESFSEHVFQGLSSLRTLTISSCYELISLSEGMGGLTCLKKLEIYCCPKLVFPSNMNRLTALRQVTIECRLSRLRGLTCLEILVGLEGIPSLQVLTLSKFPSLPDWLGAMTSLQKLQIRWCPELRSLPDSLQQLRNLHELHIVGCPKLKKRCKKGTGEDWHKIAHVPVLEFNTCLALRDEEKEKDMEKELVQHHDYGYDYLFKDEFNRIVDAF